MHVYRGAWPLFTTVLCPVDFSPQSRVALQYAAVVARRTRGSLSALFVNDPLLVAAAAAAYDTRAITQTSERELREFVRRTLGRTPKDAASVTCKVTLGDPPREIAKTARAGNVNLIVIGTQGLSGARKAFFGSTTESVLRNASIPVLAVPSSGRKPRPSWPMHLMAALDLGSQAGSDARRAEAVALWCRADLTLVHVVPPTQAPRWLTTQLRKHDQQRLQSARERLDRLRRAIDQDLDVTCHVLLGQPAEQLPAYAADAGSDLVVVTLRTRGGLFGTPQGSITYRVLCGTGTPVLALPPKWHGHR